MNVFLQGVFVELTMTTGWRCCYGIGKDVCRDRTTAMRARLRGSGKDMVGSIPRAANGAGIGRAMEVGIARMVKSTMRLGRSWV